jgi:hypothetical protein
MTTKPKTQLERIRGRLHEYGWITRSQCLSQYPAITRLGARICDLEAEGYVFKAEWKGGDYVYTLLAVNGVPFTKAEKQALMSREQAEKEGAELCRMFDNYKSRPVQS